MKRLFKEIIKLELDFLIKELKTLHKIKKINEDLEKSNKKS